MTFLFRRQIDSVLLLSSAIPKRNEINRLETSLSTARQLDHQHDSSALDYETIKTFLLETLSDKWKILGRELDVDENEITIIAREQISLKEKFSRVRSNTCDDRLKLNVGRS